MRRLLAVFLFLAAAVVRAQTDAATAANNGAVAANSGSPIAVVTVNGTPTDGQVIEWQASTSSWIPATVAGGSAFSAITTSTNTTATMTCGTGCSIAASGSGSITATAVAIGNVTGLGAGIATFLATPSGANLAAALTTALPTSAGGTGTTAPGTAGTTPKYNGSTTAWKTYPVDPATEAVLWDDFTAEPTGTGNMTFGPFECTVSGSSSGCAVNTYAGDANTVGVAETLTGSTTTGAPYITTSKLGIFITGGEIFKTRVYWPTASSATDIFSVQAGLCDQTGSTACTGGSANALMFYCDANANANWQIAAVKAGTGSFSATTTTCPAATWADLEIDVNSNATSIAFKVNGVAVNLSPLSSNIPTAGMRFLLRTVKAGGSTGTTSMKTDWDYGYFWKGLSR